MQTLQQTMTHRGAGVTRTHTRWHPYTPPRPSASNTPNYAHLRSVPTASSSAGLSTTQDASYLITPASSMYSISPSTSTFSSSPRASSSGFQLLKTIPGAKAPTAPKPPFGTGLVGELKGYSRFAFHFNIFGTDQAVKSLTEIWRPEFVPQIFCTSTQVSLADSINPPPLNHNTRRATLVQKPSLQLPSPCSPSTQPSPPSYPNLPQATSFFGEQYGDGTVVMEKELVPLRIYVHEVLRRSRTTFSVLQSAVCYIEAIRGRSRILPSRRSRQCAQGRSNDRGSHRVRRGGHDGTGLRRAPTANPKQCQRTHCSRQHTNRNPRSDRVDDSSSRKRWRLEETQSALEAIAPAPPSAITSPMSSKGVPGGTHPRIQIPARSLLLQPCMGKVVWSRSPRSQSLRTRTRRSSRMASLGWEEHGPVRVGREVDYAESQRKHDHAWFTHRVGDRLPPNAKPCPHGRQCKPRNQVQCGAVHATREYAQSRFRKITNAPRHPCEPLWSCRAASSAGSAATCVCRCPDSNGPRLRVYHNTEHIYIRSYPEVINRRENRKCVGSYGRNRSCDAPAFVLSSVPCRAQPRTLQARNTVQLGLRRAAPAPTTPRMAFRRRLTSVLSLRSLRSTPKSRNACPGVVITYTLSPTIRCTASTRPIPQAHFICSPAYAQLRRAVHAGLCATELGYHELQSGVGSCAAVGLEDGFADRHRSRRPRPLCKFETYPRWPSACAAALYCVFPSSTSVVNDSFSITSKDLLLPLSVSTLQICFLCLLLP